MSQLQQKNHTQHVTNAHSKQIIIIADNLLSPYNYGMLIRTAEAMGVVEIIFLSDKFVELTPKMKKTSRSAENNLDISFTNSIKDHLENFRIQNYQILGLEICHNGKQIQSFIRFSNKIVLIIGSERYGVSEEVLSQTQQNLHIPMFGNNSSLNVVVATGMALFQIIIKDFR